MKSRLIIIVALVAAIIQNMAAQSPREQISALKQIYELADSVAPVAKDDPSYWKQALLMGKFDPYDTTIVYPKFIDLCLKTYRWGDKLFNSYDSTYVVSPGTNWKVMAKADCWFDTYSSDFKDPDLHVLINSNPALNTGLRVSFMAVGVEYMPDIGRLFSGDESRHQQTKFSFTCSRISAELYYNRNDGATYINRFGDRHTKMIKEKFYGLERTTWGLDAFYFFNNRKYAHAAAYCFSKIQRKSAGTFILGFQYSDQDIDFDASQLPESMRQYMPDNYNRYESCYRDYAINVGYGYNWVFHHNWLFNVTVTPSLGIKRGKSDTINGSHTIMTANLRGRLALVRHCGRFFYGFHGFFNGYTYRCKKYTMYNQINDFTFTAGFRF